MLSCRKKNPPAPPTLRREIMTVPLEGLRDSWVYSTRGSRCETKFEQYWCTKPPSLVIGQTWISRYRNSSNNSRGIIIFSNKKRAIIWGKKKLHAHKIRHLNEIMNIFWKDKITNKCDSIEGWSSAYGWYFNSDEPEMARPCREDGLC